MNTDAIVFFTVVLFGAWIGWAFLWAQVQSIVNVNYVCNNVLIGNTSTICGSSGCSVQTSFVLHCDGSVPTGLGIQWNQSGVYDGTKDQAWTYFNSSVIGVAQSGFMRDYEMVSKNSALGPFSIFLVVVLTCASFAFVGFIADCGDQEQIARTTQTRQQQQPQPSAPPSVLVENADVSAA